MHNGLKGFPETERGSRVNVRKVPAWFNPLNYGSTISWARVDDISFSGPVSLWPARIGGDLVDTSTSEQNGYARPVPTLDSLNRQVLSFQYGGVQISSGSLPSGNAPRTLMCVVGNFNSQTSTANCFFGYGAAVANQLFGLLYQSGTYRMTRGGTSVTLSSASDLDILVLKYEGTTQSTHLNGSKFSSTESSLSTVLTNTLGFNHYGGTRQTGFYVYEMAAWDIAISDADIVDMTGVLNAQYGK